MANTSIISVVHNKTRSLVGIPSSNEELPWRTAFRVFALRLRALANLLLARERRRIAHPKAQGYAGFQSGITAGICDMRNGLQYKFAQY
jgi:hypothetical protein